jgi:hypothetical protein
VIHAVFANALLIFSFGLVPGCAVLMREALDGKDGYLVQQTLKRKVGYSVVEG